MSTATTNGSTTHLEDAMDAREPAPDALMAGVEEFLAYERYRFAVRMGALWYCASTDRWEPMRSGATWFPDRRIAFAVANALNARAANRGASDTPTLADRSAAAAKASDDKATDRLLADVTKAPPCFQPLTDAERSRVTAYLESQRPYIEAAARMARGPVLDPLTAGDAERIKAAVKQFHESVSEAQIDLGTEIDRITDRNA